MDRGSPGPEEAQSVASACEAVWQGRPSVDSNPPQFVVLAAVQRIAGRPSRISTSVRRFYAAK
jgi:hypothetical protein